MKSTDNGATFALGGKPNVNAGYELLKNRDYPEIAEDYLRTFKLLKSLPCDLFLGAHGDYYGMLPKYERLATEPAAFIDIFDAGHWSDMDTLTQEDLGRSAAYAARAACRTIGTRPSTTQTNARRRA